MCWLADPSELQVMGIPFVAFDAGGVLEMFSGKLHPDNVVLEPTLEALSVKLNKVRSADVCLPTQHMLFLRSSGACCEFASALPRKPA